MARSSELSSRINLHSAFRSPSPRIPHHFLFSKLLQEAGYNCAEYEHYTIYFVDFFAISRFNGISFEQFIPTITTVLSMRKVDPHSKQNNYFSTVLVGTNRTKIIWYSLTILYLLL